jgi:hypothetical protein
LSVQGKERACTRRIVTIASAPGEDFVDRAASRSSGTAGSSSW